MAIKIAMTSCKQIFSCIQALKLGGKFYAQALRLHNSAALWHDFGLNYFYQAQSKEGEEACGLAAKAVQVGNVIFRTTFICGLCRVITKIILPAFHWTRYQL